MIGEIKFNSRDEATNASYSQYQPGDEIKKLTSAVANDYQIGSNLQTKPFEEFNDRSLVQTMNANQKAWNSYIEPRSGDPDDDWKANTVRPITRNKIISIAAHVTATVTYPNVFAQNTNDDEDKESAEVMRDLIEWTVKNSDYEESFLFAVLGALINPAIILEARYVKALQTIKRRELDGTLTKHEVIDDVLSGFQTSVVPLNEFLITNPYEYNLQKQRAVIRRKYIEFAEAKQLYGKRDNFKYVSEGVKTIFSPETGNFYDQKDEELETLVEEVTYYNRLEDLELTFVNGILVSDPDQPIRHRDTKGKPIYPFAKGGYEPIDEKKFFYYKSAVSKLGPDQELVNQMWRMIIDGTFLSLMPPINVMGDEEVGSAVIIPGVTNYFAKDTKVEPFNIGSNFNSGYNALAKLEESMSQSSQDEMQKGIGGVGGRTAFEVGQLQQNARIQLGLFGKMIGGLVVDFGNLMVHDIINHMTVGQVEQLLGGDTRMKFKTFTLPQSKKGNTYVKKIEFTDEYFGKGMTEKEKLQESYKLLEKEGGMKSTTRIARVNPIMFAELDFKLFVEPDSLLPKNEFMEKALDLEGYDRMIENPVIDQEAVTRDFLVENFAKGNVDKYMRKGGIPLPNESGIPTDFKSGKTSNLVEQLAGNQSAKELLRQ